MALAPTFGAIRRIRTSLRAAAHGANGAAVDNRAGPIYVAFTRQPAQDSEMHQIPNALLVQVAQPSPAGHARAKFLGQQLPRHAAAQHEQDADETGAIG